ncbi:ABC-type sugar transport system permease component I [Candidatus Phytoplasma solani]|uniref:ABC-type sugar transport system, permease component n=1 Tax=Candidatus Phytoplasma solani TaxID=69896 RepID=A0A421NXF9_9MOLU|nr:sugar ABC transporter permease [Candidatus Phytoplasma solani]RMI88721.1 ABC-type sugar transport system, permease component [Candidatus Phytoplasma solani]CCP88147.1 ABC-type maltose transport system, permease component [Candidatus Phytoplasma solani]CCP88868.1 ABC-type maltose transport system, permease component [Candidatus Phytoplasma solani]
MSLLKKIFQNHRQHKHWYFLAPALVLLILFNFYPLIKIFYISLDNNYNKFSDYFSRSFGIKNYTTIFGDADFQDAFLNTVLLVFIAVPLSIFLSLMIAVALGNVYNRYFKNTLQTIFFLPYLTNSIIMGMVFALLFYHKTYPFKSTSEGLFNQLLTFFGISSQQDWINVAADYSHKMFVLIFCVVWKSLPFQIVIFTVSLQNIGKDYYNAARIDGASKKTIFKRITLPLLSPIIFYQLIIAMIQMLKEYETVVGVFGNNESKVNTIVGYIYNQISTDKIDSFARGAAATIILLLISVLFTVMNFFLSKRKLIRN